MNKQPINNFIYYDSKCIICKKYIEKIHKLGKKNYFLSYDLRNKTHINHLEKQLKKLNKSLNLNDGIIFIEKNEIFQGKDAIIKIENLIIKKTWVIKVISKISQNKILLSIMYPIIKLIRKLILKLKKIDNFDPP